MHQWCWCTATEQCPPSLIPRPLFPPSTWPGYETIVYLVPPHIHVCSHHLNYICSGFSQFCSTYLRLSLELRTPSRKTSSETSRWVQLVYITTVALFPGLHRFWFCSLRSLYFSFCLLYWTQTEGKKKMRESWEWGHSYFKWRKFNWQKD